MGTEPEVGPWGFQASPPWGGGGVNVYTQQSLLVTLGPFP